MRPARALTTLISTTLLAFGATRAWAQTTAAPAKTDWTALSAPLQLEVAVRGYGADDRARSLAGDSAADKLDSYVWADRTLCALGAGSAAPSNTPWVGWHFVGSVQGTTSEGGRNAVTYRVEWQRIWENGVRVAEGAKGVSAASLREGEKQELDRAATESAGACGTTNIRLEVGVVSRAAYRLALVNGARDMLAGAQAARRGAAAGGAGATVAPKASPLTGDYAQAFKTYRLQGLPGAVGSYDAEIWLVHRRPDGTESTELKQTVRFTGTDVAFTFPGVVVNSPKGDLTLDFSGTLRAGVGPDAQAFPGFFLRNKLATSVPGVDGKPGSFFFFNAPDAYKKSTGVDATVTADNAVRIAVTFARRIRGGSPAIDTRGGSYFFMEVPAPTDVVSFEFPSLPNVSQDLLKGHTFSLRIRVTPVAK